MYETATLELDKGYGSDYIPIELNVDGKPILWQLYQPEEDQYKDPNMYLWVRRCTLHTTIDSISKYFDTVGLVIIDVSKHELFPELWIIKTNNGRIWYACQATINT